MSDTPSAPEPAALPDADLVADMLKERWPIRDDESLLVEFDGPAQRVRLTLSGPRHRYAIGIAVEPGPAPKEPWSLLVDALDAMFGQLIESDRDHRALPAGPGVEFQGASLDVVVEHRIPELDKLADQLLKDTDN